MKKLLILLTSFLFTITANAQYGQYVGGDISLLPSYEEHNSGYLDGEGNKIDDLLKWFVTKCGWNSFRVRLFVNPTNPSHDGVIQNIDYVKKLGKRIKDADASFMLDFHYSDTWVDATHIQAPSVCSSMTVDQKAEWIYNYTKESLQALKDAGAQPDLVQIGNEIMYGFMGIKVAPYDQSGTDWDGFLKVLGNAAKAVREVCPDAKIIVHTDRPCNADYAKYYYGKLDAAGVEYDVIGLSYYPFWHGTLTDLKTSLNQIKSDFPTKKVQIVETAYYFQYWPNTGINYNTSNIWGATANGQYKYVKELIEELANHDNVDGLFYWFPEEAGCGDDTNWDNQKYGNVITSWLNRGLWWEDTKTDGHWPVKADDGMVHYLFKNFLNPQLDDINDVTLNTHNSTINTQWYNLSGQRISKPSKQGLYIHEGKKVTVR